MAGADPARLARTIEAVVGGSMLSWAFYQEERRALVAQPTSTPCSHASAGANIVSRGGAGTRRTRGERRKRRRKKPRRRRIEAVR